MEDNNPTIGVVSVNYNSQRQLSRCLATLKEKCRADLRFIVVDNSPVSEIAALAQDHPDIVAIVPEGNLGFAGGCNRGIAYALRHNLEYILLLNPDTWVEDDFLARLLPPLTKEKGRALAGPKIVRANNRREVWYGGGRMNWWLGGPKQIADHRQDSAGPAQPTECLSGCAMLIKSSALHQVGGLAEEYFLYFEDTDYVQRFLEAGLEAVYVPEATVIHDVSSTVGFQSREYVYYFSRNRVWFMRRWARWYHYLAFMLYNTLIKLPGALVIFGLCRRQPALVFAYCQGYWHGLTRYPFSGKPRPS